MQAFQEPSTTVTSQYIEDRQDPRVSPVFQAYPDKMALMVGPEELASVVPQVSRALTGRTERQGFQGALRRAMLEMMGTLGLLDGRDHRGGRDPQASQA